MAVGIIGPDPRPQRSLQVVGTIQRDEQLMLAQLPADALPFRGDAVVEIFKHPVDQRGLGGSASGEIHRGDEEPLPEELFEQALRLLPAFHLLGLGRLRPEELPALGRDRAEVSCEDRLQVKAFDVDPVGERFGAFRDLLPQSSGKPFASPPQVVDLFLAESGSGKSLRVLDGFHPGVEAGLDHGVGEAVEGRDLLEQALGRLFGIGELLQQPDGFVFQLRRPRLPEQGVEQDGSIGGPILLRAFL